MPNIAPQYRTIVAGSGFRKTSERGRIQLIGADRVKFLQALVTNDLDGLDTGQGAYAALLTPQGRMVSDFYIHLRSDRVLADVPAALAETLTQKLDGLVFSEDVQIADVSSSVSQYSLFGGQAANVAATVTGHSLDSIRARGRFEQVDWPRGFVVKMDAPSIESFDFFVEARAESSLVSALEASGSMLISPELSEAIRIDAARPAFGVDMTEETIPLEAGLLERAISTSKGCYVGQELIIRVLHRGGGRVARRLVKIGFTSEPAVTALVAGGKQVGQITSVAESLDGTGWNALGYVHRDHAVEGEFVSIDGPDGVTGKILSVVGS